MKASFEAPELRGVLDAINKASEVAPADAAKVVEKGLVNIKRETQRRWSGFPHARRLPAAVTYDTYPSFAGPSGEVGPDKARPQGALGNIFEYGTRKNAPIPGLGPAAEAEEPRFASALEALAVKALGLD